MTAFNAHNEQLAGGESRLSSLISQIPIKNVNTHFTIFEIFQISLLRKPFEPAPRAGSTPAATASGGRKNCHVSRALPGPGKALPFHSAWRLGSVSKTSGHHAYCHRHRFIPAP